MRTGSLGIRSNPVTPTSEPFTSMSIVGSRLTRCCALMAILTACDSRPSDAPPRQQTDAEIAHADSMYYAESRSELSDSVKADIRRACNDLAASARSAGSKRVVVSDTILEAMNQARLGSCIVQAQEFGQDGVDPDLFKSGPAARNWSWHPFETDDITYGINRKNVQCEVTPSEAPSSRTSRGPPRHRASGFHTFCYYDAPPH
jgi:hypothetical protein